MGCFGAVSVAGTQTTLFISQDFYLKGVWSDYGEAK